MLYIEALELRALLSAAEVPGTLSLAEPLPGQNARIGNNPLSNGPFLGWTQAGQTIGYLIDAAQTGEYGLSLQTATAQNKVAVHIAVDGLNVTGSIDLPNTTQWYHWQDTKPIAPIELTSGPHVIAIVIESGSANFQSAVFSEAPFVAADPSITPSPAGPALPGTQPPSPPSPPSVPSPPISGNWKIVFSDEFTGSSLNPIWVPHQYWNNGPTIGEGMEESDPANVSIGDGTLQLSAKINNAFGTGYTGALVQTGGVVGAESQPTFSFKYGYAQARIKVPSGSGLWPAFWMLPASHNDNAGEIDVMEIYGSEINTVFGTVHKNGAQQAHGNHTVDLSAGWHTFAVNWEPNQITWYLDGVAYGATTTSKLIPTIPMYPIFDLALGGKNNTINNSVLPATMQVDYVRIWQQS